MESEDEIKKSLALVMQRLDSQFLDINSTATDICNEFSFMSLKDIFESLRLGSLGKFGLSFKLNTQTVCFWIREFNKNKQKNKML